MADHGKEKDKPDDKGDMRIEVAVRTPGNIPAKFEV